MVLGPNSQITTCRSLSAGSGEWKAGRDNNGHGQANDNILLERSLAVVGLPCIGFVTL